MHRVLAAAVTVAIAAAAFAQTVNQMKEGTEAPTLLPEASAGDGGVARDPDPAADPPAAKAVQQPAGSPTGETECYVRRADTDTGFVVVCEERNGS